MRLRSDAALSVTADVSLPDGVAEMVLPAGRSAMTTHVGPYSGLGAAWAALMGHSLPKSEDRVIDTQSLGIYRTDPATTPQAELRTEIYVPLAT